MLHSRLDDPTMRPGSNAPDQVTPSLEPLAIRPVRVSHVYEEILAQLEPLIRQGGLRAGTRLPSERELARALEVSRTSLREAIRILTVEGLLEPRPGRGTLIKESSAQRVASALASALARDGGGVLDIMEFRKALEPVIAASAAARVTPREIAEMEAILRREAHKVEIGEPAVDEDTLFHNALAAATKNPVFVQVVTRCMDLIQATRRRVLQTPIRNRKSWEAHVRILQAVADRDTEAAREAMHAHLDEVERLIPQVTEGRPRR